jgi:carboxypeptidase PM20D1
MTTILILILAGILFLAAFILLRTLFFRVPQSKVEPKILEEFFPKVLAEALASAIRCQTVSDHDPSMVDAHTFLQLKVELQNSFPRLHRTLERIDLGTPSLVFHWKGSQPELPPIVLTGHLDVVPVDPATGSKWEHPPFSGEVADGFIWGRGAIDCKGQVVAILQAVEHLIGNGFKPARSIYLAFGHDEEISGIDGAPHIAAWMHQQGIRPEFVLDEGSAVVSGYIPGVNIPVGLVGVGEKGYLTLEISVEDKGGHSALPPASTAIGKLSTTITRLENHPFPAHPSQLRELFRHIGENAPFHYRMVFANLWLFSPLANRLISRLPETNAFIRTTCAVTMISGGVRENVLPQTASATLNLRLFPGDTVAEVCDRVRKVIADPSVRIQALEGRAIEATDESPTNCDSYKGIEAASRQVFGNIPIAPNLIFGMTDARYYTLVTDQVYRFTPMLMTLDEVARVHGVNERISVDSLVKMAQFYYGLIQHQAGQVSS